MHQVWHLHALFVPHFMKPRARLTATLKHGQEDVQRRNVKSSKEERHHDPHELDGPDVGEVVVGEAPCHPDADADANEQHGHQNVEHDQERHIATVRCQGLVNLDVVEYMVQPKAALFNMPWVLQVEEDDNQEHEVDDHVGNGDLPAVAVLLLGQGVEQAEQSGDNFGLLIACQLLLGFLCFLVNGFGQAALLRCGFIPFANARVPRRSTALFLKNHGGCFNTGCLC
mmetsp:Transcript_20330/g.52860  ORF Transcript_20330/g.52860 Transcript_20330/m.52860 type:complete len:227 (-) Transcript_20330:160-840(-)